MIVFTVLRTCWFPVFTVLLATFIYVGTAQGRNIINEAEFARSGFRKYTTIIALWLWAYNSFRLAATAIRLLDQAKVYGGNENLSKAVRYTVPVLFGCLPWIASFFVMTVSKEHPDYKISLLMVLSFWFFGIYLLLRGKENKLRKHETFRRWLNILSLYIFSFYARFTDPIDRWLSKILRKEVTDSELRGTPDEHSKTRWQFHFNAEQMINWSGHLFLFLVIGVWPIFFAKYFGPIGLVFIALSCFTVVGTLFIYLTKRFGYPILPIFLIVVVVFTSASDNNNAGQVEISKVDDRENLGDNFEMWIRERALTEDTIKVSLISAEGGGLRSAFWTYAVMRKLQLDNPEFYRNLYAISSVSGGTVGAALYCTEQFTGLSNHLNEAPVLNNDNLSPMLAGLFYRELVQCILPVDIDGLDRSKVMDEAFEAFWRQKHAQNTLWGDNYLQLWKHERKLPALFVNSIHVESGSNAVLSNLKFDTTEIRCVDMLSLAKDNLSLSNVVGISSRFPYLQPPARFKNPDGTTWGHLADGGYYENSGMYTIYQVYLALRKRVGNMTWKNKIPVINFNLLLLSNGETRSSEPAFFLNEMSSPLNTLLNSWYSKGYSYAHIASATVNLINRDDHFFEIRLDREKHTIPLGWFLSGHTTDEIIRQAETLNSNPAYSSFTAFAF